MKHLYKKYTKNENKCNDWKTTGDEILILREY